MTKYFIVFAVFCFLGFIKPLKAQNTVTSAGGDASGSGGSVSYTTGQIVYTTVSSANNSVAQGVQQPWEISVVTEIEKA
ncbi:MAG: hypothetical protein WBJ37_13065 [Bacteroidales bacterium]